MITVNLTDHVYEFALMSHLEIAIQEMKEFRYGSDRGFERMAHTVYDKKTELFTKNRDVGYIRLNELLTLTRG